MSEREGVVKIDCSSFPESSLQDQIIRPREYSLRSDTILLLSPIFSAIEEFDGQGVSSSFEDVITAIYRSKKHL